MTNSRLSNLADIQTLDKMNGSVMPTANAAMGGFAMSADRTKEFQMELLMENLRTKNSQYKTLTETSKAVRMTMLDKRWALDIADRAILQKCLDSLQHSIKVCSRQSLVERLECLSRQLGLKFMVGASGVDLFISSDMFYLEILLEENGTVKDVKIHHEGKVEQQSCEELVSCISRGDFADFTAQLEGLTAVYQLNAEKKVKTRAFAALSALEADLTALGQIHATKDPWAAVHKSPIGLVHNRRGGHAMKLTYFVSPYDAARCLGGILTMEALAAGTGLSAQVLLESAAAHKLQLAPLLTRSPTNSSPMYTPLTAGNSATLPARFVLKFSQPMVICGALLNMMSVAAQEGVEVTLSPTPVISPPQDMKPLLALIAHNSTTADINPNKGLFVTLPDQNQCYFLTESRGLDGCLVSSVPFTHPAQVPALIARLRQQALFNALISSCVRPNSKQDLESSVMVEVSALSWQHISVLLERPGEGGMATLELELPECGSAPRVTLHCGGNTNGTPNPNNSALEERLSRVVARTLSVPLVVRALTSRWERQGFSGAGGGTDPGGPPPHPHPSPHQGNFLNENQQNIFNNQDGNLASMIGNGSGMGMQNTQTTSHSMIQHQQPQLQTEEKKSSKKRKHEESGENWTVKKSKPSMMCDLDSSSSSSESAEESDVEDEANQSNNSSNEEDEPAASPSSQPGFGSDLELSVLDSAELMMGSSNDNKTSGSEFDNSGDGEMNDLQDMDEIMRSTSTPSKSESKKHKQKNREHRSGSNKLTPSNLLMDLESSGLTASVSITPVSSITPSTTSSSPSFSSVLSGMGLDRRPGIEILPISPNTQTSLPSSLTITPITSSQSKSMDERHRSERKSSSSGKSSRSSSSERSKDKKKKKRREDSMGPPDKLPPKQDPLTKPVSVSIKPTDGSHSPLSIRSSSPNTLIRKFSPSPTHGRSVSLSKSSTGSPGSVKNMGKPSGSSSHHSSPRHSPVQCSPKHTLSGYSSPKNHGTSSPKHSSGSGSSGKPSMSTLKSAASGSPSGKSSSSGYELSKLSKTSSGKESSTGSSSSSSRDKDRKSSGGLSYSSSRSNSPKLKSSSVKLKQLDLSVTMGDGQSTSVGENLVSPGLDLSKSTTSSQLSARNRKGSLSAVIDKLKSAQHCSDADISKSSSNSSNKDRSTTNTSKVSDSKNSSSSSSSKLSDSKNQEYMVKPSSDGMKITINKTRTKDSNSNSSSSKSSSFSGNSGSGSNVSSSTVKQSSSTNVQSATGTGSPKTHTGLKPGVISGPASKKPQALQSSKSSLPSSVNTSSSSSGSPGMSSTKTGSSSSTGSSSKTPFAKSSSGSSLSSSSGPPKSSSKTSTGSPKMSSSATDLSKVGRDRDREREKSRSVKSSSGSSEKSIFSSSKSGERRSSPAPSKDDVDGERSFKMLPQHKEQNFIVEGLIKTLDTSKYQIPKLSARASADDPNKAKTNSSNEKSSSQNISQGDMSSRTITSEAKLLDFMGKDMLGSKYSFQHMSNAKLPDQIQKSQSSLSTSTKPAMNLSSASPKPQTNPLPLVTSSKSSDNIDGIQMPNFSLSNMSKSQSDNSKDAKGDGKSSDNRSNTSSSLGNSKDDSSSKMEYQKTYPAITVCSAETINQTLVKQLENKNFAMSQMKSADDTRKLSMNAEHGMKPPASMGKLPTSSQEAAEMLLDFSTSKSSEMKNKFQSVAERAVSGTRRHTPPLGASQSPSLSVHIVKSPAPSPLVIPSPHSSSPGITDDELMDEAVVGPGK